MESGYVSGGDNDNVVDKVHYDLSQCKSCDVLVDYSLLSLLSRLETYPQLR